MKAVKQIENPRLRLLIFGSIIEDMQAEFTELCNADERIQYIGWFTADDTYPYFLASDLAVFPGRHSVMWEQVAGQGIPIWSANTGRELCI